MPLAREVLWKKPLRPLVQRLLAKGGADGTSDIRKASLVSAGLDIRFNSSCWFSAAALPLSVAWPAAVGLLYYVVVWVLSCRAGGLGASLPCGGLGASLPCEGVGCVVAVPEVGYVVVSGGELCFDCLQVCCT